MNKNFKIFQIQGLSGLLVLSFIFIGLFCGFVIFPIWIIMTGWNAIIPNTLNGPAINYFQAILLWLMLVLLIYILFRNSIIIKVQKAESLDQKDIKEIINEIKETESVEVRKKDDNKE